jgi:molybdopterin-guanine dinucleotide biosynthesis protein A
VISKDKLNGLVLAGGRSKRMGHDKGVINWHGKEQRYHAYELLEKFCEDVFISCRPEQVSEINSKYKTLPDTYNSLGQYGAILTAFEKDPTATWLVLACDLPLVDEATLQQLIDSRDTSCIATTYESPFDKLPEPLITIWEPAAREVLQKFLSEGYTCPRKVLMKNMERVKLIKPLNGDALMNVNTPEDFERVKNILTTV